MTKLSESLIKEYDWRCKSSHIRPLGWKRKWILEQFQALEAEVEGLKEPIQYMIDVWDEVTGKTWRESPDHVQQKFIEAENLLKLTEAGKK